MNELESEEGRRWLRYAQEDLATAERLLAEGWAPARHTCFLAQQAAEKALKAGLVTLQTEFPFTHDVEVLRGLLPSTWSAVRALPPLGRLSRWAVGARYFGDWPAPTALDALDGVHLAQSVMTAVRADLLDQIGVDG